MRIILLCIMVTVNLRLMAQNEMQLYIANDDHTDYMWSGNEAQYSDAFVKMLDYYIALSDKTAWSPAPYQSRFNCDGNFWLWEYERHKSGVDFQKLIAKVKSGHISVPHNALVSCYGAAPAEGILRGMYYGGYLERKYGITTDIAVAMENQTLPLGLGSLWAGAGVKYSWKGVCNCASKLHDLDKRESEIYWYKGLDKSTVLMKWYSIPGNNKELGGYAEARDPSVAVSRLSALCKAPSHPYRVAAAFGYGWDDLMTTTDSFITVAKEKSDAEKQVIVSNQSDFFKAFEARYSKQIPEVSLAFGNEWDLYSASMIEVSARVKRSVEKLRTAEAMASVLVTQGKDVTAGLEEMRSTAWMALGKYYEHNWTADGPIKREERAAWQRRVESELTSYVDTLSARVSASFSKQITRKGNRLRFYVFNPLSWKRTDVCEIPKTVSGTLRVIDLVTSKEIPSEIVNVKGQQYIRILASDVPSVGYKVFEVVPGKSVELPKAASLNGNTLENDFYKLAITGQGVISSLVDKRSAEHEYVASISGKLVNDLGAGSEQSGSIGMESNGPVSATLLCKGKMPLAHNTRITLYKSVPRIEINNEITQNFGDIQSWSFSFNLPGPSVWHEETGAVLNANLSTNGGHYSGRNSRLEWLTMNHFAEIANDKHGITISNADCSFMKLGNSTVTSLDSETPQLAVLAGGQVDGEQLGILKQDHDSLFTQRFAFSTHEKTTVANAMRFSLEHQNPLVTGYLTTGEGILPGAQYSFLILPDPETIIWSLKPAEEGPSKGLIVRTWNFSKDKKQIELSFVRKIETAFNSTHLEIDLGKATVLDGHLNEFIEGNQMKTFRIVLGKSND